MIALEHLFWKNAFRMNAFKLNRRIKNLVGRKFGRLSPFEIVGRSKHGSLIWKCACDCGNIIEKSSLLLLSGDTRSCGCWATQVKRTAKKHGDTMGGKATPEFTAWKNMINRCRTPTHRQFKDYGGRGIEVYERWKTFANFLADMGRRPSPNMSIHRINNDLGYHPLNVKWATNAEQMRATRRNVLLEFKGRVQTLTDWANEIGINPITLHYRLKNGWSVERALETPLQIQRRSVA